MTVMKVMQVTPVILKMKMVLFHTMAFLTMITLNTAQNNQMQNQSVVTLGVSSSVHCIQAQSLTPWQIGAEMKTTRQVQTQKKKFADAPTSGWPFPKGPKWIILQEKETANV